MLAMGRHDGGVFAMCLCCLLFSGGFGGVCIYKLKPWRWRPLQSKRQGGDAGDGVLAVDESRAQILSLSLPASSPLLPAPVGVSLPPQTQLDWDRQPFIFPAEGPLDSLLKEPVFSPKLSRFPAAYTGECNDVHPNADSPDMLHVVYASDIGQVEGVQASIASVVTSAASPEELTIHVIVQKAMAEEFKSRLGVKPHCNGTVAVTGVLVRVHAVDTALIKSAVAKVSKDVQRQRGAIDTLENFARFYMHQVFDFELAIYLDADTIVQADLGQLRKKLLESKRTVGFVVRETKVTMDKFLREPKRCGAKYDWKKLMKKPAYNVGVFAVNLKRWKELRIAEKVEGYVSQHNKCGGRLWVGGSQPPLLLAFIDRPATVPADFIVFDAGWNAGDLGWRTNMALEKLREKYVLHWNGSKKPWMKDGLYKELWQLHRDRYGALLKPYAGSPASGAFGGAAAVAAALTVSTTPSPEEVAMRAACPTLELVGAWPDSLTCRMGHSFGCSPHANGAVWTGNNCAGLFNASGLLTACGAQLGQNCTVGTLPTPSSLCGLTLLSSYFTTKKDWQRNRFTQGSFPKIKILYLTALRLGLNVTVIYDILPPELLNSYTTPYFNFVRVNLTEFDARYGVNDVRYFFFERLVQSHPEWQAIFIVDLFDVKVAMNPCPFMASGVLYVGIEQDKLRGHPWMKARFSKMGGRYNDWYRKSVNGRMKILNCGITGGRRDVMLRLLQLMTQTLADPALAVRKKEEDINLNMAALNFVVYKHFTSNFSGGAPVHSAYKRFQNMRKDVWFIHK